jgi:thymidylate kinase
MSDARDPIFVELAGLPASGKTTTASLLSERLSEWGLRCSVVPEAAARSPLVHLKRNWKFNAWTLCHAISSVLEHTSIREHDVVILDRGLVDALCWIEWFRSRNDIDVATAAAIESFAQVPTWFQHPKIVVVLNVKFKTALHRRGVSGRIVNAQSFKELQGVYKSTIGKLEQSGQAASIHLLDTNDLSPVQVLDEVTTLIGESWPKLRAGANQQSFDPDTQ